MGRKGRIPAETLLALRTRLGKLPARDPQRRWRSPARGVVRRERGDGLSGLEGPAPAESPAPADRGQPRASPLDMTRFCEIIAALKIRTRNRQGRHLSTDRAIEILEKYGVETPDGLVQAAPGSLRPTTVNRWLRVWGLDHTRMTRAPAAVRFEAEHANDCWQFDMCPSDLKQVPAALDRGGPRAADLDAVQRRR